MSYELSRVREAVQFLVDSPYFSHYAKRIRALTERPRSLPYKDDTEALNELVIVGRANRQALENLLELAELKRDGRGDYQRQYMAAQRSRYKRIAQLEALLRGKPLTLDERQAAISKQYEVWNKEKDQFLSARSDLHLTEFGTPPDWTARNAYTRSFWEMKDAELDALLAEAEKTLTQVVKRKRLVVVPPTKQTQMAEKLLKVLDDRRK
jgi:hypothetical protein